jgi:hypothetical protein
MLHSSTKKLIDKLLEMTLSSKIDWKEGDDGSCHYDTEGYRVTIGQAPSRLVLQDSGGRILETASETLLTGTNDDEGVTYAAKVDTMVSDARRQMTGSTEIIDKIVSALDLDGDGIPDIEQTGDEAEQTSEAERMEKSFPDQTEMASRVAMLAETVNGSAPAAGGASAEQEIEVAEETPTEDPVEADAEPEIETGIAEVETIEAGAEEEAEAKASEGLTRGDAVTALAGGMAALGAGAAVSAFAEKSGMVDPDNEDTNDMGEGWTVPEAADASEMGEVEEIETNEIEPVTEFSPSGESDTAEAPAPEIVESEEEIEAAPAPSSESFGGIGSFGAPVGQQDAEALPEVDRVPDQPAEAVEYTASPWGESPAAIDASAETPAELLEPVEIEVNEEAEYLSVEVESVEPEDLTAPETDNAETQTQSIFKRPARTGGISISGLPYVTGLGRVGGEDASAEGDGEAIVDDSVSEAVSFAEESVEEITETFSETSLEPPVVDLADSGAEIVAETSESLSEVVGAVEETAGEMIDAGSETTSEFMHNVETGMSQVADEMLPDAPMDTLSEAGDMVSDTAETVSSAVEEVTENTVSEVSDFTSGLQDKVETSFAAGRDAAGEFVSEAVPSEAETQGGFVSGLAGGIGGVAAQAAGAVQDAAENVSSTVSDMSSSDANETADTEDTADTTEGQQQGGFLSGIAGSVGAMASQASEAAKDAVEGLTGGAGEAKDAEAEESAEEEDAGKSKSVYKYNPWM